MKKVILFLIIAISGCTTLMHADTGARKAQADKIRSTLPSLKTGRDSLSAMYDIFDLVPRKEQQAVGQEIFQLAGRLGVDSVQLDVARLMTGAITTDEGYHKLIRAVKALPDSRDKEETLLFLQMRHTSFKSKNLSESDRQKEIATIIAGFDSRKERSHYNRLLDLYTLVSYLRNDEGSGTMMINYLTQLNELVSSEHFQLYAIPNIIYTESANIFADSGSKEEALEADRHLLSVISGLEKKYARQGRHYRNYDVTRYSAYRRMLRNYDALEPGEASKIYDDVMQIAERDPDVKADLDYNPRFHAYYYMATHKYGKAIPYLQKMAATEKRLPIRKRALEMLNRAARESGDHATLLSSLTQYVDLLELEDSINDQETYKELQIRYEVNDLRHRNNALEEKNRQEEEESAHRTMSFLMLAVVIISILILLFLIFWTRHRLSTTSLEKFITAISQERNKLRDSNYRDQNSLPYSPDKKKSARSTIGHRNIVKHPSELLNCVFNNLLYISSVGRKNRVKHVEDISLDRLMRRAATNTEPKIQPGVTFDVRYPEHDITLHTDLECALYILEHILANGATYTSAGAIHFTAIPNVEEGLVKFLVTDSGETFTEGTEEFLFENFVDMDKLEQRPSAGLFLCRLNSMLLKCDLRVDQSYKEGTRFVLIMPISLADNLK